MFFTLNRWQIRNETFHEKRTRRAYLRDRKQLINDITERYMESKPAHPAINRLMGMQLTDIIMSTNSRMATWKKSYDLVINYLKPGLITSYLT